MLLEGGPVGDFTHNARNPARSSARRPITPVVMRVPSISQRMRQRAMLPYCRHSFPALDMPMARRLGLSQIAGSAPVIGSKRIASCQDHPGLRLGNAD